VIENQKKIKCGNRRNFCINLQLKDGLGMEFIACEGEMMPARARRWFTVCDACRYSV